MTEHANYWTQTADAGLPPGLSLPELARMRQSVRLGGKLLLTSQGAPIRLAGEHAVAPRRIRLGSPAKGRRGRTHVETPVGGGETVYVVDTAWLRQSFPILMGRSA